MEIGHYISSQTPADMIFSQLAGGKSCFSQQKEEGGREVKTSLLWTPQVHDLGDLCLQIHVQTNDIKLAKDRD